MSIRVLIVKPGEFPVVHELPDEELPTLYAVLDCRTIQCVPIGGGYIVWLDDNGLMNGKPQNGCGFLGTYFFSRRTPEGNIGGLDDFQIGECFAYWTANRHVPHPGVSSWDIQSFDSIEDLFDELVDRANAREQHFTDSLESLLGDDDQCTD